AGYSSGSGSAVTKISGKKLPQSNKNTPEGPPDTSVPLSAWTKRFHACDKAKPVFKAMMAGIADRDSKPATRTGLAGVTKPRGRPPKGGPKAPKKAGPPKPRKRREPAAKKPSGQPRQPAAEKPRKPRKPRGGKGKTDSQTLGNDEVEPAVESAHEGEEDEEEPSKKGKKKKGPKVIKYPTYRAKPDNNEPLGGTVKEKVNRLSRFRGTKALSSWALIAQETHETKVPDDSDDETPQQKESRAEIELKHGKKEKKKRKREDDDNDEEEDTDEVREEPIIEDVDMIEVNDSLYDDKY
ncbi:MAG: hypothetical protein Q9183_007092, partial [Haloplaca sp. 2 TL-2023]